jgi:hypothetical protein
MENNRNMHLLGRSQRNSELLRTAHRQKNKKIGLTTVGSEGCTAGFASRGGNCQQQVPGLEVVYRFGPKSIYRYMRL